MTWIAPHWRPEEFPPNCRSTDRVYNFLRKIGGVNPYGENNYLAVIASEARFLAGGEYHDYPESVQGLDQGGIEFDPELVTIPVSTKVAGTSHRETVHVEMPCGMHVKNQPLRVVKEMRWVERWPQLEGWVILHWEPGGGGCSRQWWEQWKVPGTHLQMLGPWPERGMYWTFCEGIDLGKKEIRYATFSRIPAFDWMERAIAQFEHNRGMPDTIADRNFRMMAALSEARERKAVEARKAKQELKKYFDDITRPLLSSSLEAGRAREHLARKVKARTGQDLGHVGA